MRKPRRKSTCYFEKNGDEPLVSIVIPVYNGSNYLSEAIDSALAQTYTNIEVIVINDGSNDNDKTRDTALSYGRKIRYFEKENGGVSTALNLGIRKMRGRYFAWLSHDDIYHPCNISVQLENIMACENNCISACSTEIFEDCAPAFYYPKKSNKRILSRPLDHWKHWIYACSLVIPKDLLEVVKGLNESNRTTQDNELVWDLLSISDIHFLGAVLVFRRVHPEQGYNNSTLIGLNLREASELLQRKLSNHGVEFFLGKKSSESKKASTLIYIACKYAVDKRRREFEGPQLILWLISEAWKINPQIFSLPWMMRKMPISIVFSVIDIWIFARRLAGFLFRKVKRLLKARSD